MHTKKPRPHKSADLKELLDKDWYDDPSEELRKKGIYYITNEVVEDSLLAIQQDLLLKHLSTTWKDDIQIFINTVGGDCAEGWALIDLMQTVRMDVRTIGIGECLSLGACLLAAGTKGKRIACPNTTVMIHSAQWDGTFLNGDRDQIVAKQKYVEEEYRKDIKFWRTHSKYNTPAQVKKHLLNGKDVYLSPKECMRHGIVDHVIGMSEEE